MTIWLTVLASVLAALIALPCGVVFAQCVVAALPFGAHAKPRGRARPPLGVLIPAHDEEAVLRCTLESILPQLVPGDRLLVVADNCSDATAQIAEQMGAEVRVRSDPVHRGKGYALQAGLEHFGTNPPAVAVVVDADCRLSCGSLDALAARVAEVGRPVQACYLMMPPANPRAVDVVSSLAVLVKNRVRPLAMAKLGLPCLITGSGSAFPWMALQTRSFAADNIVEDMQLGIDLALAGSAPTYCDEAVAVSALPERHSSFVSQRRRWEHGHLQTFFAQTPRLLLGFLKSGRPELATLMLDLAVPPLSLLVMLSGGSLAIAVILAALGASGIPALVIAASGLLVASGISLAWWQFARDRVPFRVLLSVPVYVVMKLPLYAAYLFQREQSWIRTPRSALPSAPGE